MKMTQSLAYVILPNELIGKGHEVLLHELNDLRYLFSVLEYFRNIQTLSYLLAVTIYVSAKIVGDVIFPPGLRTYYSA